MVYLDNAATSFPKPREVLKETCDYMRRYCANPGRSSHKLASRSAWEVFLAREAVASFIGLDAPERIVFTQNATHALNIAIKTAICEPCHVLISDMEHNSVVRPLERLRRTVGIERSMFSLRGSLYDNLCAKIRPDTRAVICTLASNVTGERADREALSRFCRERGLKLILDASQLIGHEEIDLAKTPCSMLCAPGHKALFGLQGSGFVAFADGAVGDSFMEGGSGGDSRSADMPSVLPERYEAGTLATPSIVSLRAGIEYVSSLGIERIRSKLSELVALSADGISELCGFKVLGKENGILLFTSEHHSSTELSELLDKAGICVRGGLHCAPSAHALLGTIDTGGVRASFSAMNTESDARALVDALYRISREKI